MLRRLLSDNRKNANFSLNKNIVIRLPCPPLAKRGSLTHSQALALSKRARDVTALWCSEPLRYKVGGASKPSPCFAGWDRRGTTCYNLLVETTIFVPHCSIALHLSSVEWGILFFINLDLAYG